MASGTAQDTKQFFFRNNFPPAGGGGGGGVLGGSDGELIKPRLRASSEAPTAERGFFCFIPFGLGWEMFFLTREV